MEKRHLVVLLDSYAIIHRAYHALPGLATSGGKPTGAIYGFLMILSGIIDRFKPDHIIAAFDRAEKTFRHEAFDDYKGKRGDTDDDLITQIGEIRDLCHAINLPVLDAPGFEADDILGTLAQQLSPTCDIVIASGDMDTLQLVSGDRVRVFTSRKGLKDTVIYNEEAVNERFGFGPESIPDYKALRGDPSDNIPGIRGIGEKTATELIRRYKNIETVYENIASLPVTERMRSLIAEGRDDAEFSLVLATIRRDAPLSFDLHETPFIDRCNYGELARLCAEYEFRSLADKFARALGNKATFEKTDTAPMVESDKKVAREIQIMRWILDSRCIHESSADIMASMRTHTHDETHRSLVEQLKADNLYMLWSELEEPLQSVVDAMRERGMQIDTHVITTIKKKLEEDIERLGQAIRSYTGDININSPKQLGEALYDTLGLKPMRMKKTSTGARSTREEELAKMREQHPVIDMVLEYRERQKLLSTYIEPLETLASIDGRIHPTLWQDGTVTGRFSSEKPNIQNIPIRTDLGRMIRTAFVAPEEYVLVRMDYSQIELRVTALLSGDHFMKAVFTEGRDIHTEVAAKVFHVPADAVTADMRRRAKVINFGIIYGMGVSALQKNLGSSRAEAEAFYNAYFEQFPTIADYFGRVTAAAARTGYTTTLWGRRRYFTDIRSRIPYLRAAAERMAMNAPVQGTAADIMKFGMLDAALVLARFPGNHMIAQVHDELLFEVRRDDVDRIIPELRYALHHVLSEHAPGRDSVPLVVDVAVGHSWGDMKSYGK